MHIIGKESIVNENLIQEYATGVAPLFENSEIGNVSTMGINNSSKVYYGGPLQYTTSRTEIEAIETYKSENTDSVNTTSSTSKYNSNIELVDYISEHGTLADCMPTMITGTTISSPLEYLKGLYPSAVFTNDGYYNMGESAIYPYDIDVHNGCAMYAIAAVLAYHMNNNSNYSTIVGRVLSLFRNTSYYEEGSENYYLDNGEYVPFIQQCLRWYGLNLSVDNTKCYGLNGWTQGTNEISNNRPVLLNIWHASGGDYYDHTVTAYAWSRFVCNSLELTASFFKVRDGYYSGATVNNKGRYVAWDSVDFAYFTRIR